MTAAMPVSAQRRLTEAVAAAEPHRPAYHISMRNDPAPTTLAVGVTGHRRLGDDPRTPWFIHAECVRILDRLRDLAIYRGAELIACSALAVGADQLFARAALGLGLPLIGVVPFADYPDDFSAEERPDFERLLGFCREVHRLPVRHRSDRAYLRGGTWIVDRVQYVIAVWDGEPAKGVGGTGDVVAYAHKKGRAVFRIDPRRLEVS